MKVIREICFYCDAAVDREACDDDVSDGSCICPRCKAEIMRRSGGEKEDTP